MVAVLEKNPSILKILIQWAFTNFQLDTEVPDHALVCQDANKSISWLNIYTITSHKV